MSPATTRAELRVPSTSHSHEAGVTLVEVGVVLVEVGVALVVLVEVGAVLLVPPKVTMR